jgi:hypothetical protein
VQPSDAVNPQSDLEKFRSEHAALNAKIYQTLQTEIATSGEVKGRILEVFGGELWYRITLELINRYFKLEYKRYIQETLDTEGKSK